jgi:prepilin-type processing-associated H-X9-DG protein
MNKPEQAARPGFTLVELLVLVVIIGVGLGLLLPLIFSGRPHPARRIECLNNLKHIGLALQVYCEDYGNAPPSFVSTNFGKCIGETYSLFHCPSDRDKKIATNLAQFASNPSLYCSYWYLPSRIPQENPVVPVAWDRGVCELRRWPTNSAHKGEGGNILWSDGHVDWNSVFPTNLGSSASVVRFE